MKTLKTAFLSTLAAFGMSGGLFAATTWSGTVSLDTDLSISDELVVESGAAVDLNGHSVTLNGKLTVKGAATITNSDSGDVKDAKFYCSNDLESQFQDLTFSGNLKLTVGGKTKTNVGFQGVTNTHTGGTVLDGYTYASTDDSKMPRFNTASPFGTGALTLANGSQLRLISNDVTLANSSIVVEGESTSVTNYFICEKALTFPKTSRMIIAETARLNIQARCSWGSDYIGCDLSGVKGILCAYPNYSNSHVIFSGGDQGFTNGVLEVIAGESAIRWAGTRDSLPQDADSNYCFDVGAIQTPESVTEPTSVKFINTSDKGRILLRLGAANKNAIYYGRLSADNSSSKDIALEKIGTGTQTLGNTNDYYGATYLTAGAIKLLANATLGRSADIVFRGGELVFGENTDYDPSSRFATNGTTIAAAKIGVDDGVTYTMAGNLSKCDDFEKTRGGTLVLSSSLSHKGNTTVSAGTLVVPVGGSLGTGALSIASGAKVLIDASSASWDDGDTVSLFTVGSLDAGTTLSIDNIGLYGVSGKTAIDSITLDGTTVKATVSTKTLLWNGGNGTWDTTSANWVNKADTTESLVYAEGDKVEFGGDTAYTVTISSDVTPSQLTLAPEEGGNVTFAGDGAINLAAFVKGGAGTVTLGNGKNPFTTIEVTTGTLALGADQPVSVDNASLYVEGDAVLDLNGHSLVVGYAGQRDQSGNSAIVTNSQDAVLGSLTVGTGNTWPDFNARATLGGYMNYIVTGYRQKHFRDSKSTLPTNTISGMVAMKDQSGDCRIYGAIDTGSADIGFLGNAKLCIPSSNLSGLDGFQGIHVEGENNRFKLEGYSGGTTIKFNGPLTGDGSLILENGFKPSIRLDGDTSDFEGTLYLKYSYDGSDTWRGIFFERANNLSTSDGTASLEKATVVMTNETSNACNKLWIAGGRYHGSIDTFPIGDLSTATSDFNTYTNSALYTYKDGVVLEVGALGKSSTFAASIREQERSSYHTSLVKVGTGTWTLTGTNHYYLGTTTVKGGRLNIDSAEFTAGTEVVATNAVLGGTGTIKVPITIKKDGTLAGSLTATSGVTFEAGSFVEVAADASSSPTISSSVNIANLTVKLTGTLDTTLEYTILTAGSGSSGRATLVVDAPPTKGSWRTKWVTSGDTKILKGYYVKPGLVIIFK